MILSTRSFVRIVPRRQPADPSNGRPRGHIEPLSAFLRLGGPYGTPCRFSMGVRYLSPTEVELVGGNGEMKPNDWRDIRDLFLPTGVEVVRFKRLNEDGTFSDSAYVVQTGRRIQKERAC